MREVWLVLEDSITSSRTSVSNAAFVVKQIEKYSEFEALCVILGPNNLGENRLQFVKKLGFKSILSITDRHFEPYSPDLYLSALITQAVNQKPSAIVFPSQSRFNDIISHLAKILGSPCLIDYDTVSTIKDKKIYIEKKIDGKDKSLLATVSFLEEKPLIISIRKGIQHEFLGYTAEDAVEIKNQVLNDTQDSSVKAISIAVNKAETSLASLSNADVVVAGGGGVKSIAGWELIKQLASELNAKVAGSRGAFVNGYITRDQMIGISGLRIDPRLYFAIGISGSNEHLIGIKDAEFVICLNKDMTAPIFNRADLGLVADLYQFLPQLLARLHHLKTAVE